MYRLKNNGLKIQPLRTPLEQGNERVASEFDRFMAHDEVEHKLFIMYKQPPILISSSLYRSTSCQTESHAFLKSTTQA